MRKIIVGICLAFFGIIVLNACGEKKAKKIKVGLSMDTYTEERWKKDADLFIAEVEKLGGEVILQTANGNEQLQNEQIENLLTSGVDVLVVVPHNSKTTATAVRSAHNSDVKVIAYDRIIKDCDLDLYVSFDAVRIGEMQAEYLRDKVPTGNYLLIGGAATDENSGMLKKGQMKVLQPMIDNGSIKIIIDQPAKDWLPIEALKYTENGLTITKNKIDAILTANDGLASGAIQALAAEQLAGKVIVTGQDAELAGIQRIIDGTQSMTIYKPLKKLAEVAAQAAMALAKKEEPKGINQKVNNGKVEVPAILLDPVSVDKSNVRETVISDNYIDKSLLKGL